METSLANFYIGEELEQGFIINSGTTPINDTDLSKLTVLISINGKLALKYRYPTAAGFKTIDINNDDDQTVFTIKIERTDSETFKPGLLNIEVSGDLVDADFPTTGKRKIQAQSVLNVLPSLIAKL